MSDRGRTVTREVLHSLTLNTEPWLSCDDCFEQMDGYVERKLADPGYVDPVMATHLDACSACAEEAESLYALVSAGSRGT
jgi:hypothetical protein